MRKFFQPGQEKFLSGDPARISGIGITQKKVPSFHHYKNIIHIIAIGKLCNKEDLANETFNQDIIRYQADV